MVKTKVVIVEIGDAATQLVYSVCHVRETLETGNASAKYLTMTLIMCTRITSAKV